MNLKKTGAAAVLVVLALWLGYYLGHQDGIQQERRAWLATEQTFAPPPASTTGRPAIQTSRWTRTYYTYPHSGQTFIASKGPMPMNQRDLRNTLVGIKFVGLTNNPAALLGTSDKVLAVFSVTNRVGSPIQDAGFYYIETSHSLWTYSPLGSGSPVGSGARLAPHSCGTILTRVPTNGAPWRIIVPYSRTSLASHIADVVRAAMHSASSRPCLDFERYGKGAPASDWVKLESHGVAPTSF